MATLAATLDNLLRSANIPIEGVSIGNPADKSTWIVQFLPAATGPQRTQAAQIISTFDLNDPTIIAAQLDADAALQFDGNKMFRAKAVSDLAWRLGKAPSALTSTEISNERTRIINIYKAL